MKRERLTLERIEEMTGQLEEEVVLIDPLEVVKKKSLKILGNGNIRMRRDQLTNLLEISKLMKIL